MKKSIFLSLLLSIALMACNDDGALETAAENAVEFQGTGAVIRAADLSNIRFKDVPGSVILDEATPRGEIRVEAAENLEGWLEVRNEGGELRIEGKDNLPATLDLNFYVNPLDIARIVVEGDNKVIITSMPVLDYLELVTEGESELLIHNLKVKNLISRREGKSRMFLSSRRTDFERDSVFFLANTVQVLDEHHILYRENNLDYLLFAPQLRIRNDSVFALGYAANEPLRSFFITQNHELRNEGESSLDALELPTVRVSSRNEGKSSAKVWAITELNVRGEGESVMYYRGNPAVEQRLEGEAKLIKL